MGMAWINNAVPGRFGINYYMCTGEDPRDYDFLAPKVSFDSIYTYFTLIIAQIVPYTNFHMQLCN